MEKRFVFLGCLVALAVAAQGVWGALPKAQAQDAAVPAEAAAQIKPVMSTYNLMETFFEGPHEALLAGLKAEPASGKTWRELKGSAQALAEAINLTLVRPLEDESKRAEWTRLSVENRTPAEALATALEEKNYAGAKEKFLALVASCNACHTQYPDNAPQVAAE